MERMGIVTAGCWIVDRVKIIDHWPAQEALAFISAESRGGGGGACNTLCDLSNLGVGLPLAGIGRIGDDADGAWLRADLDRRGIAHDWILTSDTAPTAYTDVMSVAETGRRTFFHNMGANNELAPDDFPYDRLTQRLVYLGYPLVLGTLDQPDAEYGSVAARVLARLRETGIMTVCEPITEDTQRARDVVRPCLKQSDVFVCNELEAGIISGVSTGRSVGDETPQPLDPAGLRAAAARLIELGVSRMVVVHMPDGGYVRTAAGDEAFQPSLDLPAEFVAGTAGAGDAFTAGVLYGLHEGWELPRMLRLAVATAAASLRDATCSNGVGPLDETLGLLDRYPTRPAVM